MSMDLEMSEETYSCLEYSLDSSFESSFEESSVIEEIIPLNNSWCLWFDRYIGPGFSGEEYAAAMLEVALFDDIQSYWRWMNNLPSALQLEVSCTYHLMKKGIRPIWEDQSNVNGGSFSFRISALEAVDDIWTTVSLNAVAGQFDLFLSKYSNDLCGVSIGRRKNEASFTIWVSNEKTFDVQMLADFIADLLKDLSVSLSSDIFSFKVHQSLDNFGNQAKHIIKTPTRPTGMNKSRSPRTFNQPQQRTPSKKAMRMKIPKHGAIGR